MTHRRAVLVMVAVTLMWSIAGVVSRQLEAARSFEVTFWRSSFNALGLVVLLAWLRGPAPLMRSLREGGRTLWLSGLCWSVMFTAFMISLTLTTMANALVVPTGFETNRKPSALSADQVIVARGTGRSRGRSRAPGC